MRADEYYHIQLSSKLFWGYTLHISVSELESFNQKEQEQYINLKAKQELRLFFKQHNLQALVDEVDKLNLHLHKKLVLGETNYICENHNH